MLARCLTTYVTNLKMAFSLPVDLVVSVQSLTDPLEIRPKDDQAIVIQIDKDVPNLTYCDELNKYINDEKSFLYVSRISGDRLCVVFKEATQTKQLVEQVRLITVNNIQVPVKFLVAKSIKVIIANAGYGISNSTLKKYITNTCKIRTSSSVSELKAYVDSGGSRFNGASSFRRVIYIHPDDAHKLLNRPVKFTTGAIGFNVFFDIDKPKCFLCSSLEHFKKDCPQNNEENEKNKNDISYSKITSLSVGKEEILRPDGTSNASSLISSCIEISDQDDLAQKGEINKLADHSKLPPIQQQNEPILRKEKFVPNISIENLSRNESDNSPSEITKRALSDSSSETSNLENSFLTQEEESIHSDHEFKFVENKRKSHNKKIKKEDKSAQERYSSITSSLEPARSTIDDTSEKHKLKFNLFVELLVKIHE